MTDPEPGVDQTSVPRAPRGRASASSQVRGSALLLGGRVLAMGLGLVIQLALVRVMTKDDYGAFAWALSVVTLVQALIPLGLDRIDSRFLAVSDERGDDRTLVGVLVGETLVICGLGSVAFLVILLWHSHLAPGIAPSDTAATLLVLMVILAPLGALDALVLNTFATFGQARSVFYRRYLLEPVLRLSAVGIVFWLGGGVYGLTIGYVLASVLGVGLYAVMLVRLLRDLGVLAELHGRIVVPMREMMREGLPLLTSTLVYAATNALPPLVLGAVGTAAEVASLRAVQPVATLSLAASSAFAVLYLPMAARLWDRGNVRSLRITYWRTALWVAVASYPALIIGTAFAAPTTVALLGERYAASAPLMAVSAFGFWFQSATGFSGQILSVSGRKRLLFWANIASLLLGAISAAVLVPRYGAGGAAASMAITLVGSNLFRQLGLAGLPPGIVDRHVAAPYVVMGGGVVAAFAVQNLVHPNFAGALVVTGVISAVLAAYAVPYLDIPHTFPELLRLPVVGPVLRVLAARRKDEVGNPFLAASEPEPPGPGPDRGGGDDPALPCADTSSDLLTAVADLHRISPAAEARLVEGLDTRTDDWAEDPRAGDFGFLVPSGTDATVLGPGASTDLESRLRDMHPGEWVVLRLPSTRASLGSSSAELGARGFDLVQLYWEAPRRSGRTMFVPLDDLVALRASLRRHEGSRRGRMRAVAAVVLARVGLVRLFAVDRVVVGRRSGWRTS